MYTEFLWNIEKQIFRRIMSDSNGKFYDVSYGKDIVFLLLMLSNDYVKPPWQK